MRYFLFLFLIGSCFLSATEPLISSLLPRGGQKGTQQKVVINGNRLQDAQEIFFYDDEIVAGDLKMESGKKISTTFSISPDAKFGQHEMRVRAVLRASHLRVHVHLRSLPRRRAQTDGLDMTPRVFVIQPLRHHVRVVLLRGNVIEDGVLTRKVVVEKTKRNTLRAS